MQRCVRKLKSKITKAEYSKLYPTGSNPGKFYGTAKIHKLSYNDNIDQLPLRALVSNIGIASYHLNILRNYYPRSANQSTRLKIPKNLFKNLKMLFLWIVSFDVSSLFISLTLDFAIDVILRRIYREKEIVKILHQMN